MDNAVAPVAMTTPTRTRSFSDPPAVQAALEPSPTFHERRRQGSKDDSHTISPIASRTPGYSSRRPDVLAHGLSLQMPGSDRVESLSPARITRPVPLSPQLDQREIFVQSQQDSLSASPATSIPRHSRGLDFSRASTNLHHSTTIPEHTSPDSSPILMQKGMMIPRRKGSISSMMLDSPFLGSVPWASTLAPERSTVSSSVGSINMLGSDSDSSESDDDASMGGGDEAEDAILTTPQVHKLQNPTAATPFAGPPATPGGNATWGTGNAFSPAQASLMRTIRRAKPTKHGRKSRKSSSSASNSGYSSMASPRTTSPPPMRSIETSTSNGGASGGYFSWAVGGVRSRRESLALGTDGLHLSSGNDSGDEASVTGPATPGVVRRPVTRRGNLLPKTKGFARIRAALLEEAAPIDTEIRRESETIRQVRERDNSVADLDVFESRPGTATAASSPNLLPAVPESAQEDFGHELDGDAPFGTGRGLGMNFAAHASRNSGGLDYWNRFDASSQQTPPPPSFPRHSSSAISDFNMDSPIAAGSNGMDSLWRRPRARSSASDASEAFAPMSGNSNGASAAAGVNDDVHLKKFKRRREDDFDIATIKRRAVSPGMSAQNSPVMNPSPSAREIGGAAAQWGLPPPDRRESGKASTSVSASSSQQLHPVTSDGQVPSSNASSSQPAGANGRSNSSVNGASNQGNGNGLATQGRKLGLQGMVDTNDGLMKMSIE